jgi:hypothetical protein
VDENTVYVRNIRFYRSVDGGKTYERIRTHHGDYHNRWINPQEPRIMIVADDGGATVTLNGGKSCSEQMNQPTAEFYCVATDNQFPYRVYGCQQDNSSLSVPSRRNDRRRVVPDIYPVGGGEQGYVAVHPTDANIVLINPTITLNSPDALSH